MPNWVRNIVKMEGIGSLPLYSEYDAEQKKWGSASEYFDFQKLIPMPKSLRLEAGYIESVAMEAARNRIARGSGSTPVFSATRPSQKFDEWLKRKGMTPEELEELGLKYLENAFWHGHTTWFGWCCENWGTKWNSSGLERIDDDTIAFNTAWSNPEPIIAALSAQYPDRMIEHWWADEDTGENTGYRCIQDGCRDDVPYDSGSQEALETYVMCWGMDERLERDEHGNLRVIEADEED